MRLQPRDAYSAPMRRWRALDVVTLVVAVSYGAAALMVAAGLFIRLAR